MGLYHDKLWLLLTNKLDGGVVEPIRTLMVDAIPWIEFFILGNNDLEGAIKLLYRWMRHFSIDCSTRFGIFKAY